MSTDLASTQRTSHWLVMAGRIAGAALTGWSAGIHLYLWFDGYRDIETIGILFLLNAIGGFVVTLALLATPTRLLAIVSALGALYAVSVLGALIISMTVGLFGFDERLENEQVVTTLVVNSAALLILGVLAARRGGPGRSVRG